MGDFTYCRGVVLMVRVVRATAPELTVDEAAGVAGVVPVTVRWWLNRGLVKGRILPAGGRTGGRAWRVDANSLRLWVNGGRARWLKERSKS